MQTGELEVPKHRKKIGKKPFVIQYRSLRSDWPIQNDWSTHSRYEKESQRLQALASLQEKTSYGTKCFEYRAKPA